MYETGKDSGMRIYWELYKKELFQHRQEYFFFFFFMTVSILSMIFDNPVIFHQTLAKLSWGYPKTSATFELMAMLTIVILQLFPPSLLIYSLYDEKKTRATLQNLSLPIPRYAFLLYKCLSILSMCLIVDTFYALTQYILTPKGVWINYYGINILSGFILTQYSILGITASAVGFSLFFRRNRVIVGILFALALLIDFRIVSTQAQTNITTWIFDKYVLHNPAFYSSPVYIINLSTINLTVEFIISTFLAGLLFLAGLFLYHKRAEA
jgi:hypothetical protein